VGQPLIGYHDIAAYAGEAFRASAKKMAVISLKASDSSLAVWSGDTLR
jgi:hypothetical protein